MKHTSIILRATCYFLGVLCIGFGKEFYNVGAAKLHDFLWSDWVVLSVSQAGECLMTMVAFFDKSFGEHMANGGGPPKPYLSSADFKALMEDWAKEVKSANAETITKP